jgi:hypothetical protein
MQVMAGDTDVDSKTGGQGIHPLGIDRSRSSGGAGVGQSPQAWNIGEIKTVARSEHTRGRPIHRILKPLRHDFRLIGPSIPVPVKTLRLVAKVLVRKVPRSATLRNAMSANSQFVFWVMSKTLMAQRSDSAK